MNDSKEIDVAEATVIQIVKVADLLARLGNTDIFGKVLSQAQFHYLMVLRREGGGVSQKLIQERLVSTKGNISLHTANLIKKGFIRRKTSVTDARINVVTLTAKGEKILNELEPKYMRNMKELTIDMSPKEADKALQLLRSLQEKCEIMLD